MSVLARSGVNDLVAAGTDSGEGTAVVASLEGVASERAGPGVEGRAGFCPPTFGVAAAGDTAPAACEGPPLEVLMFSDIVGGGQGASVRGERSIGGGCWLGSGERNA